MADISDKLILDKTDMKNKNTSHLRIYVGHLPDEATQEALYEHFISYGQINGILIQKKYAFIQFENESSAMSAISQGNRSLFMGHRLIVKTAQILPRDQKPMGSPGDGEEGEDCYDRFGNFIEDRAKNSKNVEGSEPPETVKDIQEHPEERGAPRGRGDYRGRGRGRGRGRPGFRDRSPHGRGGGSDWGGPGRAFDPYPPSMDYGRAMPVHETNDCEIIVVSKTLTEYAEYIEGRLKRLGIVVDLMFPVEDVTIGKVLGNIASRGTLYAILIMPQNQEHRSLTLTMLHGLPQEHRNMPIEDALQLLSRNYEEVKRGGASGREAMHALLGQLADGKSLTVLQYDKVLEYLQEKREQQVKIELGEPLATKKDQTQDLQQRILSILKDKIVTPSEPAAPAPVPLQPPPAPKLNAASALLNDENVKKAISSLLEKY